VEPAAEEPPSPDASFCPISAPTPWNIQPVPPVDARSVRMRWEGISDHGFRMFVLDLTKRNARIYMAYGSESHAGVAVYQVESVEVRAGRVAVLARGDQGDKLEVDVQGTAGLGVNLTLGKLEGVVRLTAVDPRFVSVFPVIFFTFTGSRFVETICTLKDAIDRKASEATPARAP
jgi:hypothetical protein